MPASLAQEPSFGAFMDPESPFNHTKFSDYDLEFPTPPFTPAPWTQIFSAFITPPSSPTLEASAPASPADSDDSLPPTPCSTRIANYDTAVIANFDGHGMFDAQSINYTSDLAQYQPTFGLPCGASDVPDEQLWAPCGASSEFATDNALSMASPKALSPADFLRPVPLYSLNDDFPTPTPIVAPDDDLYCSSQMSILFVDGSSPLASPLLCPSSPIATSSVPTEEVPDVSSPSTSSPPPRYTEEDEDDLADGDSEYFPSRRTAHPRRSRRSSPRKSHKKTKARMTTKPSQRQRRQPEGHRVDPRSSSLPSRADTLKLPAGLPTTSPTPSCVRRGELKYTPSRTNKSTETTKKDNELMCPIAGCNSVSTLRADVARHLLSHGKSTHVCFGVPWEDRAQYGFADEKEAIEWPDVEGYYVGGCGQTFVRRDALSRHIMQSKKSRCVHEDFARGRR